MTTSDLIWRLIEILLENKEKKSEANDKKERLEIVDRSVCYCTSIFYAKK